MKTLQNNFTTPEQSKRLLALGVPAWTADCYYYEEGGISKDCTPNIVPLGEIWEDGSREEMFSSYVDIPCWSAGRLIEIICNCHVITNQLMENWICCDKDTNLIELLIRDIEAYTNVQNMDFSKLEE